MPEGGTISLRRARALFAYWQGERLLFHNFANARTITANPIVCQVLDFFGNWRTPSKAIAQFSSYEPNSVRAAISQLRKHDLLLVRGSTDAVRDAHLSRTWADWLPEGSFHFCTKDTPFIDRSRWTLARQMAATPKTPPPKIFKTVSGPKKRLPRAGNGSCSEFVRVLLERKTQREFSSTPVKLETIAELLRLVWGVQGYLYSPRFGKMLRKTSASGGARHPIEVYLMALRVRGLRPGLYHYHPDRHHLTLIKGSVTPEKAWLYCARQHDVKKAAALFIMTAVFERSMWKYRHPRAYRTVLLDAGHLGQTFYLVATWLGLAPFCTAALKDTLIDTDLGLDGISESVVYVAGVGVSAVPD